MTTRKSVPTHYEAVCEVKREGVHSYCNRIHEEHWHCVKRIANALCDPSTHYLAALTPADKQFITDHDLCSPDIANLVEEYLATDERFD